MRDAALAVFPVFRSRLTAAVVARTYIGEGSTRSPTWPARPGPTPARWPARSSGWRTAGVVRARMVGRTKLVQADRTAPFYRPLRDLVVIVLGPAQVLGEELAGLGGVSAAAVFGSWAARALGEAGPSPVDIDLVVILVGLTVTTCTMRSVGRGRGLGWDINSVVISTSRWRADGDPFPVELGAASTACPAAGDSSGPDDLAVSR